MGNVTKHFLLGLFNIVLAYIVLINFMGWSGGNIGFLGNFNTRNDTDWSTSYFGFQSLQMMFAELKLTMFADSGTTYFPNFTISNFYQCLNDILNTVAYGIPQFFKVARDADFRDVLKFLMNIFLQPMVLLMELIQLISFIVYWVFCIISVVFQALAGAYNIPMENLPEWYSHPSVPDIWSGSDYVPPIS